MTADTAFPPKTGNTSVGINVFTTPRERHDDLVAVLGQIADLADSNALPKNRYSSFHPAIDAPIVVNYVQYQDPSGGRELAKIAQPLVDRTHELSTSHDMRYYDTVDIVTASGDDSFAVVAGKDTVAVIGVYVVEPDKRDTLLAALESYAASVKTADGFQAIAIHRGQKPEFAATYEVWSGDAAHQRAAATAGRDALERARAIASEADVHSYRVVRVNRHRGA